MSASTARLSGLESRKGALVQGHDADIVIFDDDAKFTVDPIALQHRHAVTPYAGLELFGRVVTTFVGGRAVFG
jgi:allantoinase